MTTLIVPLDDRVPNGQEKYLLERFGATPEDLLHLAIELWPKLGPDVTYREEMDTLAHSLSEMQKFEHLSYGEFMDLSYRSMTVIGEFREMLQAPMNHMKGAMTLAPTDIKLMGWLPEAVVLDVGFHHG